MRIKEQETHLTLQEHDDDDDEKNIWKGHLPPPASYAYWYVRLLFAVNTGTTDVFGTSANQTAKTFRRHQHKPPKTLKAQICICVVFRDSVKVDGVWDFVIGFYDDFGTW